MTLKLETLLGRHNKMLEYQQTIKPFTPTVRELADLWGIDNCSVLLTLKKLVGLGYVVRREHGKNASYYAVNIIFGTMEVPEFAES